MKIVYVQPYYFNIWEAIGIGYIGSYVKDHISGIKQEFYQSYFDDDETILSAVGDADVVAFSCTTPTYAHAIRLATKMKELHPNIWTVFGGFHPSAMWQEVVVENCVDIVVVGNGEVGFKYLLTSIGNGNVYERFPQHVIFSRTPKHFDVLPDPDRELIKNNREINLCNDMIGKRITSVQSCRVCPFNCAFCSESSCTGKYHKTHNPIRQRSNERILNEINNISMTYKLDEFKFCDATWNTSPKKVIDFCLAKQESSVAAIPFEANIHASLTNKEMFKQLALANCKRIAVGVESGSPRLLKYMRKGITLQKVKDTFRWAREYGIERRAYIQIGMPMENVDDIKLTESLLDDINPDIVGVTITCPYPGSDMYSSKFKDVNWENTDEYSNDFWRTEYLSNDDLKYWQGFLVNKFKDVAAWHNKELMGKL